MQRLKDAGIFLAIVGMAWITFHPHPMPTTPAPTCSPMPGKDATPCNHFKTDQQAAGSSTQQQGAQP